MALFLHPSGGSVADCVADMRDAALRGYVAAAIDLPYHGVRAVLPPEAVTANDCAPALALAPGRDVYQFMLAAAFRGDTSERPYLLDAAWDALAALAVLRAVSAAGDDDDDGTPAAVPKQCPPPPPPGTVRAGITGVSLGGTVALLVAALDPIEEDVRCCPLLGAQAYGWALAEGRWGARAASLPVFFAGAAAASNHRAPPGVAVPPARDPMHGRHPPGVVVPASVNAALVAEAWRRLCPGMLEYWDLPALLATVAPRPLLVLGGARDERCPPLGAVASGAAAIAGSAWRAAGRPGGARWILFRDAGHEVTRSMAAARDAWLDTVCLPNRCGEADVDSSLTTVGARRCSSPPPEWEPTLATALGNGAIELWAG